jgi:hypothetical protein
MILDTRLRMNEKIEELIFKAVENIISKSSSKQKISHLEKKHAVKIHFIPKRYRIFGGLLQSMNIQFGNFIEELMALLIENEKDYEIIKEYSGKKSNSFFLSRTSENLIDEYVSDCQLSKEGYCNLEFHKLQKRILEDNDTKKNSFKHDIDLIFKDKKTGKFYYIEIKYNDDHDTGKFVDINRKFIKTYAYLLNELKIKKLDALVPILFFFNNKKMKGNPYIPEGEHIFRGERFFNDFLSIKYKELNDFMENLSESSKTLEMFEGLYDNICNVDRC